MSNEENCNMQNMVATISDDGITFRPRESHEDLNELKRQIWALDATVHNLRLKNEALQEAIVAKDNLISAQKDVVKELNLQLEAVGASPGIPGNFITHRAAWRNALEIAKSYALGDDVSYWEHEIKAFERSFDRLWAIMQTAPQQEVQALGADSAAREQNHVHIQRFNNFAGIMNPESRGLYVRYEDYAAHIAALTAPQPAPSIGADDEALIRLMLKALVESNATLWEEDDDPARPAQAAIAAARARLGEGGGV